MRHNYISVEKCAVYGIGIAYLRASATSRHKLCMRLDVCAESKVRFISDYMRIHLGSFMSFLLAVSKSNHIHPRFRSHLIERTSSLFCTPNRMKFCITSPAQLSSPPSTSSAPAPSLPHPLPPSVPPPRSPPSPRYLTARSSVGSPSILSADSTTSSTGTPSARAP